VYLFLTLLFDIAQSRTLWLRQHDTYNRVIAIVFTVAVVLKLGLLLLEAVEKRRILRSKYRSYPPEATAGVFNKSFFWWINPLFRRGFSKTLTLDDLFLLDKHLLSERHEAKLENEWRQSIHPVPNSHVIADVRITNMYQPPRKGRIRYSW
jgi:ATP-binding cassette, subfamily C (CFTR/MRP), member 1